MLILSFFRTVLAIAGEDFSVIASDTRLSEGFQIYTRDLPKTYQLYVYSPKLQYILVKECGPSKGVQLLQTSIKVFGPGEPILGVHFFHDRIIVAYQLSVYVPNLQYTLRVQSVVQLLVA